MKLRTVQFLFLLLLPVQACANAPDWAVRVMDETHRRVIVQQPLSYDDWFRLGPAANEGRQQKWFARDLRYIPAGKEVWGNCATFAMTAMVLALKEGHDANIVLVGKDHVVAVSEGWMFDALNVEPVKLGDRR